jgi:nucleoside-diphosphate-sugar epimerase
MRPESTLIISGASGAIGTRLVHAAGALPRSVEIIPIYRSITSRDASLATYPVAIADRVNPAIADVTVPQSLEEVCLKARGSRPVIGIHAAADVAWDKNLDDVQGVNVEGALNFARAIAASSPHPRLVYVSTAYTHATCWRYRNGYEESKAMAERLLRQEFRGALSVFSCSLVVGCSQTGVLARHNGIYPLLRFIALTTPPFLVGRAAGLLDVVPVDWVVDELLALTKEQLRGDAPRDLVAAAGEQRIRFDEVMRIIENRLNSFRQTIGFHPIEHIPILRNRQWDFLRRSLIMWKPPELSVKEFRYFERLLAVYRDYTESDTVRPPEGTSCPTPSPYKVLPTITDRWLLDNGEILANKWLRGETGGKKEPSRCLI